MIYLILVIIIIILIYIPIYNWANDISIKELDSHKKGPILLFIGSSHGNEPAGTLSLKKFLENPYIPPKGKIIIIECPNKIGYLLGIRWLLHRPDAIDLNRNYGTMPKEPISKKIASYVDKADFIVDFHEGWGFHKKNSNSIGSTLSPTTKLSYEYSLNLIKVLNENTKNPLLDFTINPKRDNLNTLRNYAYYKNKNYILVECSGQNDIQSKEKRISQNMIIINNIINYIYIKENDQHTSD